MNVDVIMLTKSSTEKSIRMTMRTILTMKEAEPAVNFKVHLVESGPDSYTHYSSMVENYIRPAENFNYNRFLNIALEKCTEDWVVISNDDVGYEKGWFSEIMKVYQMRPDIHSFSPKDPVLYMKYFDWHFIQSPDIYFESYIVSEAVMGWCLVIKKESLDKILPFDEQFDMYYQDNDYVEMLKKFGIKHALVRHSVACHFETMNIQKLTDEKLNKMNIDLLKFKNKWKQ
jgi:GT2 family glycosyltransferase